MIRIETKYFSYTIGDGAENVSFTDKTNNRNYLDAAPSYAAYLTMADESVVPAVSAAADGDAVVYTFADGNRARVGIENRDEYVILTLLSVDREDFLKIAFINIPISADYMSYVASDEAANCFTATLMGLTCATRRAEHPGRNLLLRAEGYPKIGLSGTHGHRDRPVRAAVFGAPDGQTRNIMKRVMNEIPDGELPKSKKGGPYAMDCREGRDAYITYFTDLKKDNAKAVADKLKSIGCHQLSMHQGRGYRQGDFALTAQTYPNGMQDLKETLDILHENGIRVLLHSYTFFVDRRSSYLTPVPHEDLDAIVRLTLAADLDETCTEIRVVEPTDGVSELYSYDLVSSPFLKIDKELIVFGKVRHEPPYAFIECERGANGTKASAHKAGAEVRQLKEYFKYVLPKADSPLFYEVAKNTADFYNEAGFDGFYMDAIDGVFAMEGNEYAWYYAMEFITEVMNRLNNDPIFDCCYNPQYTASFYARSRYGALDYGTRAVRNYLDAHVYYNDTTAERMYEPPELGWFSFYSINHLGNGQTRLMREEDTEYLCNRILSTDACFAFCGTDLRNTDAGIPLFDRNIAVFCRYDEARDKITLTNKQKKLLRTPKNEYSLCTDEETPYFRKSKTLKVRGGAYDNGGTLENPLDGAVPALRFFPLHGAAAYDGKDAVTLLPAPAAPLPAHSEYAVDYKADPDDAQKPDSVGFSVYGDGSGAILRVRLSNHVKNLVDSMAEYHVKVDFCGWRYFSFYETETADDPYGAFPAPVLKYRVFDDVREFYAAYRNARVYQWTDRVELDVEGEHTDIRISDIRLLRSRKIAYQNPAVTIGDKTVVFPCTVESGQALECDREGNTAVIDELGNVLQSLPKTALPPLPAGESRVGIRMGTDDPEGKCELVLHIVGKERL